MEERWAIFGLLDLRSSASIRLLQTKLSASLRNDRALRFPVHITVRGRFMAGRIDAYRAFDTVTEIWNETVPIRLGAVRVSDSRVAWIDVSEPDCRNALALLHHRAETFVASEGFADEVPPAHKLDNYKPHVTLAWDCPQAVLNIAAASHIHEFETRRSYVVGLALLWYPPSWSDAGKIKICRQTRTKKGFNDAKHSESPFRS